MTYDRSNLFVGDELTAQVAITLNRQPKTHGASDRTRAPGSISSTTTPGRVPKGRRMAGRMGGDRVTAQNLEVVAVDGEKHLLAVRGSVPGAKGGIVLIKPTRKGQRA